MQILFGEAGGLKEEADIQDINLAYPVEDGQKIVIPKKGEQEDQSAIITQESGINQESKIINKKININKATQEELQNLQGIRRSHSRKNYYLSKRKSETLSK